MAQRSFNGTKINVEFSESSSRQQLNSGENISKLFGKIKKIFSDLTAVCFSGSYKDLSDTPIVDSALSRTSTNPVQNNVVTLALEGKASIHHMHPKSQITDFPTTMPANGGNADTVGNISDGYYLGLFSQDSTKLSGEPRLYGKYNGKTNDGRIFLTTTPNPENKIHEVAVTYAYDAALLNHRESGRIATKKIDGTYYNPVNQDQYDAYIQWNGSYFMLKTYSGNATAVDYAYTANTAVVASNADAVNGVQVVCANDANTANWLAAFTSTNNLRAIDPARAYVGNAGNANMVRSQYLIGTSANCAYNTILAWANAQTGTAYASIVAGDGFPYDAPYQNEAMLKVESDYYGARKIVTWTRYMGGQPRLVMIRPIFGTNWNDDQWRT